MIGSAMALECGGQQTESLSNVNQDTGAGVNNNNEEIEDDVNQSSQRFTILRNEVPPGPQNTLSPATNSETAMSQSKILSPRTVNKIIVSRPAGSRDVTPTVGVSPTSLFSQTKNLSVRPKVTTVIGSGSKIRELDEDMDTRSANTTDAVKEEISDDEYESLLAPATVKTGFDDDGDIEILEIIPVGSGSCNKPNSGSLSSLATSNNKQQQVYPCGKCKRILGNKGAWRKHTLACYIQSKEVEKFRADPSTHTCLDCFKSFSNQSKLQRHKRENCKGKFIYKPFMCKYCNATFTKKGGLAKHVRYNCPVLKKKVGNPLRKDNSQPDSEDENNLARQISDKGGEDAEEADNDVDEQMVSDHGDTEDTLDDFINCKQCGGLFTKEKFERHREQTGHTGDIIKLPPNLTFD